MPEVFSQPEMARRVAKLRDHMDREGVVCALATSTHNLMYLSGFFFGQPFGRICVAVVPLKGEPCLVAPRNEARRAQAFSWFNVVREYTDNESPLEGVTRLAREITDELGLANGRIGVEDDVIPFSLRRAFGDALPEATLVDISDALERQRLVKSEEEIALSRHLARICEVGVGALEDAIHDGVTEIEVAAAGERAMQAAFAERFPEFEFNANRMTFKAGSGVWGHFGETARRVQHGDHLRLGAQPIAMGYFSTLTRSRVLGEVPEQLRGPFNVVIEAQQRCIEAVKPGVEFAEIDDIALRVYEKAGMAQYKGRCTGHSHGLMGPFWGREKLGEYRPYNHTVLAEGMITSMEPSLYIPDLGSFGVNDMVLVTKQGAEVLTHYPRELTSIGS